MQTQNETHVQSPTQAPDTTLEEKMALENEMVVAFEGLRASDKTYARVMARAEGIRDGSGFSANASAHGRKARAPWRVAAIVAGTLACGSTALALVGGDFFASAFGDKGQKDIPAHVITNEDAGKSYLLPAMEWMGVDAETAEELMGSAAQHVGELLEHGSLAISVDDAVFDDNGLFVATITITDPNGVVGWQEAGYGVVYPGPDAPIAQVVTQSPQANDEEYALAAPRRWDTVAVVDRDRSTPTELHLVQYGAPLDRTLANSTVAWRVSWRDDAGHGTTDELTGAFEPSVRLASVTLAPVEGAPASAGGILAHVSPLGIVFDGTDSDAQAGSWAIHDIAFGMSDGSTIIVRQDGEVQNAIVETATTDGSVCYLFNRLIDPGQVESVTIDGPNGASMTFAGRE